MRLNLINGDFYQVKNFIKRVFVLPWHYYLYRESIKLVLNLAVNDDNRKKVNNYLIILPYD